MEDAFIDEPNLMVEPRLAVARGKDTPLGVLNMMKQKCNMESELSMPPPTERKTPGLQQIFWKYTVTFHAVSGEAEEVNKKLAQHKSC